MFDATGVEDVRPEQAPGLIDTFDTPSGRTRLQLEWVGERLLDVDQLLYSQTSISQRFSDGRLLQNLIADPDFGRVDPLHCAALKLTVADWPGRGYVSLDNRRAWCLHQHQSHVRTRRLCLHHYHRHTSMVEAARTIANQGVVLLASVHSTCAWC